jgi:peptide/nickel transport system permease protein
VNAVPATLSVTVARRPSTGRRLVRRPAAALALGIVAAFVVVALGAPWLAPFDPIATDFGAVRKAPSSLHRLGTDEVGRDVLRGSCGARGPRSWRDSFPVTIAVAASIPLGLVSGYVGGWIDDLIMRLTDAMLAVPFLIVAIALAAFLGRASRTR